MGVRVEIPAGMPRNPWEDLVAVVPLDYCLVVVVAILAEEDLGVMGTVVVVDPTTPELIRKTHLVLMMVMV